MKCFVVPPPNGDAPGGIAVLDHDRRSQYELTLERTEDNGLLIRREAIQRFELDGQLRESELHTRPVRESELSDPMRWGSEHKLLSRASQVPLRQHQRRRRRRVGVGSRRSSRAARGWEESRAFLYRLERTHPTALRRIVATVRNTFAEFNGFALNPSALNPRRIRAALAAARSRWSLWRSSTLGWHLALPSAGNVARPAARATPSHRGGG